MLPKTVLLLAIELLPLVSAGQKGLESRNGACQSGIYGELRPYLISYEPAQVFCSSLYPPDCTTKSIVKRQPSTRSIASTTSVTPSPTARASLTGSSSTSPNGNPKNDFQGSAWSKLRGLAGDIVKTLCSCIETHVTCPTISSSTAGPETSTSASSQTITSTATSGTMSSPSSSLTSNPSSTSSSVSTSSPTSSVTSSSTTSSSTAAPTSCSSAQAGSCGTTCECLVDLEYQPLCAFGTLCITCKSDADCQSYPGREYNTCVFDSTGLCKGGSIGNRCVSTNSCPALSSGNISSIASSTTSNSASSTTSTVTSTTNSTTTISSTTSTAFVCPTGQASYCAGLIGINDNGNCTCYADVSSSDDYKCGSGALCISCQTDSDCQTTNSTDSTYDYCVLDSSGQCAGSGGGNLCVAGCTLNKKRGRSVFEGGFRLH